MGKKSDPFKIINEKKQKCTIIIAFKEIVEQKAVVGRIKMKVEDVLKVSYFQICFLYDQ